MSRFILAKLINEDNSIDNSESIIGIPVDSCIFEDKDENLGKITKIKIFGTVEEKTFRTATSIENIKSQLRLSIR